MVSRGSPLANQDRANPLNQETAKRILQTMFFIKNSDNKLVQSLLEKNQDRWADLPEFFVWCILSGNIETASFLLSRGVSLEHPPVAVSPGYTQTPEVDNFLNNYRQAPYIIMAAIAGQTQILELLIQNGRKISETGHIGYSKNKLNSVSGNVLSAAIFHEKINVVRWLFERFGAEELGIETVISEEKAKGTKGGLNKEYFGFTPLLLAATRSGVDIITELVSHGANFKAVDWQKNTALHLAVKRNDPEVAEYFCKIPNFDLNARNQLGQTALSLAKEKNFELVDKVLSNYIQDSSQQMADELFNLLSKEEDKKNKKKQKKKSKKKVEEVKEIPVEAKEQPEEKKKSLKILKLSEIPPPPPKPIVKVEESKVAESNEKENKPAKTEEKKVEKKEVETNKKQSENKSKEAIKAVEVKEEAKEEVKVAAPQTEIVDKDAEIARLNYRISLLTGKGDYTKLTPNEIQELKGQLTQALAQLSNL